MTHDQHLLYYRKPASCWNEALPIGNGRIGAMISGGIETETVELNEDTLWSGYPRKYPDTDYFRERNQARKLLEGKKFYEADRFISEKMLHNESCGYLPAGSLKLEFPDAVTSPDYRRELDLDRAVASTRNSGMSCDWFVSAPHQVLAMHGSGGLSFTLRLDSPLEHECGCDGIDLFLNAICPIYARRETVRQTDEDGRSGLRFQIRARLVTQDGTICTERNCIRFNGSGPVLLLVAIRSDFSAWNREPDGVFPADRCREDLDRAAALSASELLEAHLSEYQALYRRSCLELPATEEDLLPTDERIARYAQSESPALAALLYQFGRYLLISSSRRGTQPANLQGIWNPHVLPPWGSNYTTNINLEMNYWAALPANLAECAEPLFRFIREVAEAGKDCAGEYYHARGWCLHHNSDLWRFCVPACGQARWGYWPVGGLWLCRHLVEYFRYTRDEDFLREWYPILRGNAEFALDLLVQNPHGELVTSPSTSPENGFIDPVSGEVATVCGGGTSMDLELIRETFRDFIACTRILRKDDEPLLPELEQALPRLCPIEIGSEGQLLEYDGDYEESEIHHRHLSHLYGVYPADLFTPENDPERFEAARISLIRRGDRSTGWAMCWRLALWARFRDGGRTGTMLREFLQPVDPAAKISCGANGGIYPNLFSAHPPFQIDANLGVPAGIVEMLVQCHRQADDGVMVVDLLPALPANWTAGKLTGVRLRNGIFLDLVWRESRVAGMRIRALKPVMVELRAPRFTRRIEVGVREQFIAAYQ
ncbi:glycoside hydrolase family 95 protein [uncultured Victivallis sp.]|uniref:glycoside hydrolase family 95 protein n=1 Tax=uncultured Victivallis sp. TaxID=354118 RepID=UPI0025E4A8B1|nr:glycoside hydrolase family 95 protein [uncultured Victivallis sp.]